jgi:transcription antitermination factor NusG
MNQSEQRSETASGVSKSADPAPWYALYCRARHERRVHQRLTERGVDSYLPLISRISEWHDRKKVVQWPLFPGYIFVRPDGEQILTLEGHTAGAVSLVRHAGRPAPISEVEMEVVRRVVDGLTETGDLPQSEPLVGVGEEVEVDRGPFAGAVGRVVEVRGGDRLVVQIGLRAINQGIRIELDGRCVSGRRPRKAS